MVFYGEGTTGIGISREASENFSKLVKRVFGVEPHFKERKETMNIKN